jgi:hypothetical protein
MFSITNKTHFGMTFENGWTVSVQTRTQGGYGGTDIVHDGITQCWESTLAEVAAFLPLGQRTEDKRVWYEFGDDSVGFHSDVTKHWLSPDKVADFISMIQSKPPMTDIEVEFVAARQELRKEKEAWACVGTPGAQISHTTTTE